MKTHPIKSLYQSLCRDLPGFEIKGRLLFQSSYAEILKGFCVDDSSHSPAHFYVWAFVQPLYVPAVTIHFNFGQRLGEGAGRRWEWEEVDLVSALSVEMLNAKTSFLDHVGTPKALAEYINRFCDDTNPNNLEALAYSFLLAGDQTSADAAFERLSDRIDPGIEWQRASGDRAKAIQACNADAAKELLHQWCIDTIRQLRI